ncbi:ABC transporter ATP-binding protein [Ancylobacter radicis]|uniref:ABC transporter ATP-binding protein n=1 Tax=Ancylobacter radicis TaxID=2836179 RepID=A0ABS5RCK3_9HYPH|nr:ABC transporter ATP-binding protein [Ancylobacter radicis]MBS9479045.1 ABC transporter ATP-binding protein [Ancylobacter radicis]
MIRLDHLTKRYGATVAVDDVSLDIPAGAICALVGPSGAGKSTLLRLINRLIEPDGGCVQIGGAEAGTLPVVALRRRIGYVIQSVGLFPHWSVARNIATVPRLLGWETARIERRIDQLLDLVGLPPSLATRYPHELSGGQQQRVGVARALAAEPELLLMDEPFGAVDPVTRRTLQDALLEIQARTGTTIILVTHDVDEAVRLGTVIAFLSHGRLVQAASPAEMLRAPASAEVAAFFGGPRLGLRLLQTASAGERADFARTIAGEPVEAEAMLDEVVARMAAAGVTSLPVKDGQGRRGVISLDDVVAR